MLLYIIILRENRYAASTFTICSQQRRNVPKNNDPCVCVCALYSLTLSLRHLLRVHSPPVHSKKRTATREEPHTHYFTLFFQIALLFSFPSKSLFYSFFLLGTSRNNLIENHSKHIGSHGKIGKEEMISSQSCVSKVYASRTFDAHDTVC